LFKTVLWFFLAGVLVAITLETLWRMAGYGPGGYVVERVARILWPSAVFKMALDGNRDSGSQVATVYALSFAANGVLYGVSGLLIVLAKRILARLR
jgi:hypothetical protein